MTVTIENFESGGAWARLVNSNGSDEHLELCSKALVEIQEEDRDRLVRKLEDLRRHRGEARHGQQVYRERQAGELNGLDMAIRVLKGEL